MTYTYVRLPVSKSAFDEIKRKLEESNYQHAFQDNGCIDMHGIALEKESESKNTRAICRECGGNIVIKYGTSGHAVYGFLVCVKCGKQQADA